ncbi:hypothetical protein V2J09_014695 [Rumex salicifolius]
MSDVAVYLINTCHHPVSSSPPGYPAPTNTQQKLPVVPYASSPSSIQLTTLRSTAERQKRKAAMAVPDDSTARIALGFWGSSSIISVQGIV